MKIAVVGLGLIGGSIVKALAHRGHEIYGLDLNETIMKRCHQAGFIVNDAYEVGILKDVDIMILCLYPKTSVSFLRQVQTSLKSGCIITDVAGLKGDIMASIEDFLRPDLHFIGGHPMAGRAGQGYEQSSADIFKGANYLLIDGGPPHCYPILEDLILQLGCGHIEILTAKEHDELIAYTSHMPHILAAALVYNNKHARSKHCIAGSFNEITRVADFNGCLWSELFISNKAALLDAIKTFQMTLDQMSQLIEDESTEAMTALLHEVREKKMHLS